MIHPPTREKPLQRAVAKRRKEGGEERGRESVKEVAVGVRNSSGLTRLIKARVSIRQRARYVTKHNDARRDGGKAVDRSIPTWIEMRISASSSFSLFLGTLRDGSTDRAYRDH